jgi:uncharacterized protein YaiE (UPF0345 family)
MSVIGTNQNLQIGANGTNVFNVATTSVYPDTDNATDLGFSSSLRWKNLYLSGVAYATYVGSSGDTDTSIAFDTADTIRFSTGGTERMRIDSSGQVGIGTSSPSAPIEITRSNAGIIQYITNTSSNQAYTAYGNSDNPPWSQDFNTAGGLLVGIDSDETAIVYQGGNKALRFGTNAAERMRIDASGNVGIGASSVTGNLQILTSTAGSVLNVNHKFLMFIQKHLE